MLRISPIAHFSHCIEVSFQVKRHRKIEIHPRIVATQGFVVVNVVADVVLSLDVASRHERRTSSQLFLSQTHYVFTPDIVYIFDKSTSRPERSEVKNSENASSLKDVLLSEIVNKLRRSFFAKRQKAFGVFSSVLLNKDFYSLMRTVESQPRKRQNFHINFLMCVPKRRFSCLHYACRRFALLVYAIETLGQHNLFGFSLFEDLQNVVSALCKACCGVGNGLFVVYKALKSVERVGIIFYHRRFKSLNIVGGLKRTLSPIAVAVNKSVFVAMCLLVKLIETKQQPFALIDINYRQNNL